MFKPHSEKIREHLASVPRTDSATAARSKNLLDAIEIIEYARITVLDDSYAGRMLTRVKGYLINGYSLEHSNTLRLMR